MIKERAKKKVMERTQPVWVPKQVMGVYQKYSKKHKVKVGELYRLALEDFTELLKKEL